MCEKVAQLGIAVRLVCTGTLMPVLVGVSAGCHPFRCIRCASPGSTAKMTL